MRARWRGPGGPGGDDLGGRASATAASTLGESPLVEIASTTSPRRPSAWSWRENTCSKPKSLAIAVSAEESAVSARAGQPGRPGASKRPTNSAATCCA
jgi:hypothetical protein